jgi:hypothetical protein
MAVSFFQQTTKPVWQQWIKAEVKKEEKYKTEKQRYLSVNCQHGKHSHEIFVCHAPCFRQLCL